MQTDRPRAVVELAHLVQTDNEFMMFVASRLPHVFNELLRFQI
jgi:hypothetical protein